MKAAVIHDGCGDTPGGAAKVSVELANVLNADLYVGCTGCLDWYESQIDQTVVEYAARANKISPLRDFYIAYKTGKLHLPEYDIVVTSGVPAKFYQPESFQRHVHYTHHPPLRYSFWLGRDNMSGIRGNIDYLFRKIGMYIDWLEMQRVDTILANSEATQERIASHYRRDSQVVYPPIYYSDDPVFTMDDRKDYFLYAGRLDERKRLETLIKSIGETEEQLVISGEGPLRSQLEDLAKEVNAKVIFKGFVSEDRLDDLMRKAKAGIFIPVEEDFGMAIAECLCSGTPVIVSDEPNPKYMVSEDDGVCVSPDVGPLVEAISSYSPGDYSAEAIAKRARKRYGYKTFPSRVRKTVLQE